MISPVPTRRVSASCPPRPSGVARTKRSLRSRKVPSAQLYPIAVQVVGQPPKHLRPQARLGPAGPPQVDRSVRSAYLRIAPDKREHVARMAGVQVSQEHFVELVDRQLQTRRLTSRARVSKSCSKIRDIACNEQDLPKPHSPCGLPFGPRKSCSKIANLSDGACRSALPRGDGLFLRICALPCPVSGLECNSIDRGTPARLSYNRRPRRVHFTPQGFAPEAFSSNTDAAVLTASSAAGKPAYTAICRMISRISSRVQPTFNAPRM